ncbi:hypothetical protein CTI12_AA055050 [Artemisia annua]|uniref:YqgF/RNase H-like domain-containing protein n=1 Tax=Artemisia annua TaxID=35608 RepID=A0A2U1QAH8_ARTAN|nr:hypothetical protein CTI12_AA055050 [Artemisia annua]
MKIMSPSMFYTMVKNLHPPKPGRLLGLDVGKKLIGLAVSDLQYEFAAPCGVLERSQHNPHQMAQEMQKLITDLSLTGFVVGHPLKRGMPDPTARVLDFVDDLDWTGMLNEVPYTLWDNSFASKSAKELLYPICFGPDDGERFKSQFAATDVLQAFLVAGMRCENN